MDGLNKLLSLDPTSLHLFFRYLASVVGYTGRDNVGSHGQQVNSHVVRLYCIIEDGRLFEMGTSGSLLFLQGKD